MSVESERVLAAFLERRAASAGYAESRAHRVAGSGHTLGEYRDLTDGNFLYLHGNVIAAHMGGEPDRRSGRSGLSSPSLAALFYRAFGFAEDVFDVSQPVRPDSIMYPYEPFSENIIITLSGHNTRTTRERLNDLITAFLPTIDHRGPAQIYTERGDPYVSGRQWSATHGRFYTANLSTNAWYFLKAKQKDVLNPQREFQSIRDDMRAGLISITPPKDWRDFGFVYDSPKSSHRRRGELALEKIRKYYRSMYAEEMNEGPAGGDMLIYLHAPHYLFPSVTIDIRPRVRRLRIIGRQLNSYDLLSQMLQSQRSPGLRE